MASFAMIFGRVSGFVSALFALIAFDAGGLFVLGLWSVTGAAIAVSLITLAMSGHRRKCSSRLNTPRHTTSLIVLTRAPISLEQSYIASIPIFVFSQSSQPKADKAACCPDASGSKRLTCMEERDLGDPSVAHSHC